MAEERIEIEPVLESVLRYCLKDARERMEKGELITPFSALAVGETLFMEEHPGDEPSESFSSARRTVAAARGAKAYGFCYDGFIDVEGVDGKPAKRDCLIAEGGTPGAEYGHAIGLVYHLDDEGTPKFNEEPIYVSRSLNYMVNLTDEDELELEQFTEAEGVESEPEPEVEAD